MFSVFGVTAREIIVPMHTKEFKV